MKATTDHAEAGPVDVIIFFVKHPHTRQAIRDARPMMHERTYVWTPQNGVGNVELIAEIVPESRIAKGLTSSTSVVTAPGRIVNNFRGTTETFIWPVDGGSHAPLAELAELMTHAGLPTYLAPDIDYRIWRKLCVNTTLTALTAAVNTAIGPIGESEAGQRLMRAHRRGGRRGRQRQGHPAAISRMGSAMSRNCAPRRSSISAPPPWTCRPSARPRSRP